MTNHDLERLDYEAAVRQSARELRFIEEELFGQRPTVETGLALFMKESRIYYVLKEVERLDRELRRVARAYRSSDGLPLEQALVAASDRDLRTPDATYDPELDDEKAAPFDTLPSDRQPSTRYKVDTPRRSSLRLADAAEGSTDLLLLPLGSLVTVFASAPLTAVANALAWSGPISNVRAWARRSSRETVDLPLRQLFRVVQEAGGDPAAMFGEPDAEVTLPDGTGVRVSRGMRATIVRTHPDGTFDLVEISSD